jgi:class 3 adenylate cyclase/tetratricopeptide (TPR) repeat protein
MNCSACNQENRPGARFCDTCGAPQTATCHSCSTTLRDEARFCDACGTLVGSPAPAPSASDESERTPRQYTPKHLADQILKSKSAMEGERKQVTVLFADLQGSMALAEELGAEEWHRILERFFEILSDGVHRFEGTVNQYTGDGIMALFGAPIAHEDHAQRACFAALHLREALRDFADELRRDRGISLSTRVGLNSGEVVVGKIGDDLRMDYTAQGHTVGLAQRMEQRAAPDSAYLTEHTAKLVEGYFELRSLGPFELKGVSRPTEVFALEGLGEIRTRLERSRARGFSRFVGRGEEIETLENALDGAIGGRGGIVGVVAQAGVGKSRLCMEFAQQTRASGIAVYEAHCPSHGKAIPLLPIFELLRAFFGLQDDDDARTSREKITGRLLVLDPGLEPLLPLTLDFLGVADPESPPLAMAPAERQREVLTLIRRLIQARSEREPAVLLIDDVHWVDPASDEFLAGLADTMAGTRTLLLLNFRPEYSAEWMTRSTYQQLPLHPLGAQATDALMADLLGKDPSLAPVTAVIRDRSGGNPFFVEEIVQDLREAGRLEGERGALRLVGSTDRIEVPATVQAILGARVDRLPEREKHLLQTAAAIGRTFREPLLRKVAALADAEFDDAIRTLCRGEFIREQVLYPEVEYVFRHPLTHEVAERSQLAERRRAVHAAVARELEEIHADHLDEQSPLLAHHWDEAGDSTSAAVWHRRAADWIAGSHASEASRHWKRVRTLSDDIEDESLASELGERSRVMFLEYGWRLGSSEAETEAALEEGEAWAKRRDDPAALAALYNAAAINLVLVHGQTRRAAEMIDEGIRLVAGSGKPELEFALELRAYLLAEYRGHMPDMLRRIERLQAFPDAVMDAAMPIVGFDARAFMAACQSVAAAWDGRLVEAIELSRTGTEIARQHGSVEVLSWILTFECDHWTAIGDLDRAIALGQESLELADKTESLLGMGISRIYLARPLVRSGQFEEAIDLLNTGIAHARATVRISLPKGLALMALCELGLGRIDSATVWAREAIEVAGAAEFDHYRAFALMVLARIEMQAESYVQSRACLDQAEQIASEIGSLGLLPEILEIRSSLTAREGDENSATAIRSRACELYREIGAPLEAERLEAEPLRA